MNCLDILSNSKPPNLHHQPLVNQLPLVLLFGVLGRGSGHLKIRHHTVRFPTHHTSFGQCFRRFQPMLRNLKKLARMGLFALSSSYILYIYIYICIVVIDKKMHISFTTPMTIKQLKPHPTSRCTSRTTVFSVYNSSNIGFLFFWGSTPKKKRGGLSDYLSQKKSPPKKHKFHIKRLDPTTRPNLNDLEHGSVPVSRQLVAILKPSQCSAVLWWCIR